MFVPKDEQQDTLEPLTKELRRLIRFRFKNPYRAAKELGWPDSQYVYRVQSGQNTNYILLTQLMVACGLTPNQGAALTGLYTETTEQLTPEERTFLKLYQEQPTAERKDLFLRSVHNLADLWKYQTPADTEEDVEDLYRNDESYGEETGTP